MARQHERLRVPERWQGQAKALIQQLERIHDDLYNLLGEASNDVSGLQGDVTDLETAVTGLETEVDGIWTTSSVTNPATFDSDYVESASATMYKCGNLRQLYVVFTCKAAASGWQVVGSIASDHIPKDLLCEAAIDPDGGCRRCTINSSGEISIQARQANRYACSFVYFV